MPVKHRTTRPRTPRTLKSEPPISDAAAIQETQPMLAPSAAAEPVSEHDEIARLAYSYWEARGGQHGSHEEDWLRAEQEYRKRQKGL